MNDAIRELETENLRLLSDLMKMGGLLESCQGDVTMGEVILEDEICNAMQKAWWHKAALYIERGVYEYDVFDDFKTEFLKLFRERMNNVSRYEQNKTEGELGRQ